MIKMTIIIPSYNSEKFLEKCIMSALNQTYKNIEVIVVDNESSDSSLEVAKKVQSEYPNLIVDTAPNIYKYSYQEPVEKALELSTGEYFTILGSDDFLGPDYISNICNFLNSHEGKGVVALQSPIVGVDNTGENFVGLLSHTYNTIEEFKKLLFQKCPVTTPSIVLSKALYEAKIVRWNSLDYLGACDYELYFNLAHNGVFIYPIRRWMGYYYRWHEDQCTWGMQSTGVSFDKKIKKVWREKWSL